MEAVKRINICDVKNQQRSSHRMQMRRTKKKKKGKSNTGDCESYMGNWIFCGRDPNLWERSNV